MKIVKCLYCELEREVENNIIISICPCCQVEMREVKDDTRNN